MTSERLEEMIATGETLDVEFKGEESRSLSDADLVEAVVCLANRPGDSPGWLLVGVEDDGRVTGARTRHETGTDPVRLQALVANRTRPALTPRVEVIDLSGRPVIVVEVPPVRSPAGTSDGKYVRRAIGGDGRPACVPFMFHEMQAHQADRGVLDYSALSLPGVRWEDLDPLELERFRRMIRESRGRGDRMEISNPGGFPEGVRLDNLLVTPPRPRNPLLADAFKRAGLVERTARGIDTIFYEQLRNGRPAPSYARSTEAGVVLLMPGGEANVEFVRVVMDESQAGRPLSLDDLLLLNELWLERRLTTEEAARVIQKPEAEARTRLARLIEVGLVEPRGERKGRTYHLSAAVYRRLGDKAGYVRQRGFEPLQHEQMVLQFARSHGRITRAEAAQLCRLSPDQAKRVLKRLVDKGLLVRTGSGRAAVYGLIGR